jgi:integrase
MEPAATATHRPAVARPQTRGRVPAARARVDIRIIQLMLGHASIQQTQRYLNVTDEELRKGLEVSWKNQGRPLRLATGS